MNPLRLLLTAIGGTVAYFVLGFLAFALLPLKTEFVKYPAVYRSQDSIKTVMPYGMIGISISVFVLEPVINFAPVMEVLWGVMPELFILEG